MESWSGFYLFLEAGDIPVCMYLFGFMVYLSPGSVLPVQCDGAVFFYFVLVLVKAEQHVSMHGPDDWKVIAHSARVYSSLLFSTVTECFSLKAAEAS